MFSTLFVICAIIIGIVEAVIGLKLERGVMLKNADKNWGRVYTKKWG